MSDNHLDEARWAKLSLMEQLGNCSSEVGRAFNALRSGDEQRLIGAFYRGMDLLNATVRILGNQKSHRIKEVIYARDQFAEAVLNKKEDRALEDYFMYFALAARAEHLRS